MVFVNFFFVVEQTNVGKSCDTVRLIFSENIADTEDTIFLNKYGTGTYPVPVVVSGEKFILYSLEFAIKISM